MHCCYCCALTFALTGLSCTFCCVQTTQFVCRVYCSQGKSTVAEMWRNSGLEWSSFVLSTEMPAFLTDTDLNWLADVCIYTRVGKFLPKVV